MAEPEVPDLRSEQVGAVGAFLCGIGARELTDGELARYRDPVPDGWRLPVQFGSELYELDVLLPSGFPYALPKIGLATPPKERWPHLENDGLLCVYNEGASLSSEDGVLLVQALLGDGLRLVEKILRGDTKDDFQSEFVSYWMHAATPGRGGIVSLLEPNGSHRRVAIWEGRAARYIGEDENELTVWLRRLGATPRGPRFEFRSGLLLWANDVPVPDEFPENGAQLRKLFQSDQEALDLLETFAVAGAARTDILIGVHTSSGPGFGAVRLGRRIDGTPPAVDMLNKGFRPGKVPADIAVQRAFSPSVRVDRSIVARADHNWVHGRDHDDRQHELRNSKVVCIGCGSLGSGVAHILARAGVGSLTFVDPDKLGWENLGRHELGATSVHENKADAMAGMIRSQLPHLRSVVSIPQRLEVGSEDILAEMSDATLIVGTTGDWGADSLLNTWHARGLLPPVLYGWLETAVAAAHAVYVDGSRGCLRCGFSGTGSPHLPVTEWPDHGLVAVPACGGTFSPYGAAELAQGVAHVAEAAMAAILTPGETAPHKVWLGDTRHWMGAGGKLSKAWRDAEGDPGRGRLVVERDWAKSQDCPVCKNAAAA